MKGSVIEKLYSCFSSYTTNDMLHCTCGCISENHVQSLHSKVLRELNLDDLGFYHHKAMTTWGEARHYKHYLPRILELYASSRNNPQIGLAEISGKLIEAGWKEWPDEEVKVVKEFMLLDWSERSQLAGGEISLSLLEQYARFIDVVELLNSWNIRTHAGMENFIDFVYHYGNLLADESSAPGDLIDRKCIIDFVEREHLTEKLHEEFFAYESRDPEYTEKVSIVLQVLEK